MRKTFMLLPMLIVGVTLAACQQPAETSADASPTASVEATLAAVTGAATGEVCGGVGGITCSAEGDFCKTEVGQCGVADAQGTCSTKPEVCTKEYMPVCGCDNKTYGNACEAAAAGVNVQAAGECPKGDAA